MVASEQYCGDLGEIERILPLTESPHAFLSFYLDTQGETIPRTVRARVDDLLERCEAGLAGTEWANAARAERRRVQPIAGTLKPIGDGLALFSSAEDDILVSLWLPSPVQDHVRVGPGAYVLPLLDVLDENEPVAVAFVAKDQARLLRIAAGRVLDAQHSSATVFGREKAGGWSAPRYERRREEQAQHHLRDTVEALDAFQRQHKFRRLFLAGPTEALTMFRAQLTDRLASLVKGTAAIDAHATDADIAARVWRDAERVERDEEMHLIEELITRSEKEEDAVSGVPATLHALQYHQLATLVMDPAVALLGRRCAGCARLLPEESTRCTWCGSPSTPVDLREELPRVARQETVEVELVHGKAASLLWDYGSVGGVLKPALH